MNTLVWKRSDVYQKRNRVENTTRSGVFFDELRGWLEKWWNTVLSVWYIFSIETNTKKKTENLNKIVKIHAN